MSLFEFRDPIAVTTPLGKGHAIFVEAEAHEAHWTCIIEDGGAFVTFKQSLIRAARSYSMGRIPDAEMQKIVKCTHAAPIP
jgi:hypothetical protein